MKESSSYLTVSQAAVLVGCTPRHITKCITQGKLSASKEDGKYYIDKSEFFRVFPDAHLKEQQGNPEKQKLEIERIKLENAMLKEISQYKDKEIEFLRSQIDAFNKKESQMLETIQTHTRLLEYKGGVTKKRWTNIFKKKHE